MDKKIASGHRIHFRKIVAQTQVLLAGPEGRQAFVITNVGSAEVTIGFSGSLSAQGIVIPPNQGFSDNYSSDEYWAICAAGSGTVSGFVVV